MTNAKKVLSLILATAMTLGISATAFAADPVAEPAPLQQAIAAQTEKNPNATVVSTNVQEADGFTICTVFYVDSRARTGEPAFGWAQQSWFEKGTTTLIMDVLWTVDFTYDGSASYYESSDYSYDAEGTSATFSRIKEESSNSGMFNKAYSKMQYKVSYNGASKTVWIEVNCDKNGNTATNDGTFEVG